LESYGKIGGHCHQSLAEPAQNGQLFPLSIAISIASYLCVDGIWQIDVFVCFAQFWTLVEQRGYFKFFVYCDRRLISDGYQVIVLVFERNCGSWKWKICHFSAEQVSRIQLVPLSDPNCAIFSIHWISSRSSLSSVYSISSNFFDVSLNCQSISLCSLELITDAIRHFAKHRAHGRDLADWDDRARFLHLKPVPGRIRHVSIEIGLDRIPEIQFVRMCRRVRSARSCYREALAVSALRKGAVTFLKIV
jgi:hypothetical protein